MDVLEFIEAPLFSKTLERYLSDEEYAELQLLLSEHPDAGEVIPGSGGIRTAASTRANLAAHALQQECQGGYPCPRS